MIVLVIGVQIARSQQVIGVQIAGQKNLVAKPGSIVALGIKVENRGAEAGSYKSHLDLPVGWRIVTRDFPFDLRSQTSDVRLISFAVPPDAPARQYDIRYSVRDTTGREGFTTFQVTVPPVVSLQLEVDQAPRYAVAGTKFATTFLLSNKGNSATSIRLRYRSSAEFPVLVDSTILHFGPREIRRLRVVVATDSKSGRTSHTLELEAVSGLDSTVVVRASSVVEVVSRTTTAEVKYYDFPVTVRLREVGQGGLFATQAEAFGSASLSEQHRDRLEFLLRGPETQTKSVLGRRDAYHIAYHANSFDLYAGDMNYTLSSLTEFGRYATGAGGRATVGGLTAGGFYNYNRWSPQTQTEGAGYVNYDFTKRAAVGVNFVRKNDFSNSEISTLRGLFTPFSGGNLDLEYGYGSKDGRRDDAYSFRLNGSRPWIGYDLRYIHAGPDFGGYYQNIDFLSASVNFQATRNLRVESYVRRENRNLADDTLQLYAPNDQYYQIGAAYSSNVALYYLHAVHQDRFPTPQYKRQSDAVQGRLGFNSRTMNLYLSGDYGSTSDKILNQNYPYERVGLNASYRPRGNQNYNASFEYTNGQDVYSTQSQSRLSASLGAWILFGQSTQAQVDAYWSRLNVVPTQTYSLVEASIVHVFPFGHVVTFRARESVIASTITTSETAYSLEYSVPLAIPIKRITAVGQLRGTVLDENGKGMANVLVNAGADATLTNSKGEYYFSSLSPGATFITIDQASIGLNRISTRPLPIEVEIHGGEEAHLDLGVTRSILITGTVELFGSKEQSFADTSTSYVDLGGKSGVFVELTNGKDINRRVTDNRGQFSFADIRPGQWVLKIIGGDIPEYHLIVPDSMLIDARPGEKKEVKLELRPKKRTIKMLQEGAIIPVVPPKPGVTERNAEVLLAKADTKKKDVESPPNKQPELPCLVRYDPRRKGYILQISSWRTDWKAERVAKWATEITGMKSFTKVAMIPFLGKRHRVFLGVFKSRKLAEESCLDVKSAGLFGNTPSSKKSQSEVSVESPRNQHSAARHVPQPASLQGFISSHWYANLGTLKFLILEPL